MCRPFHLVYQASLQKQRPMSKGDALQLQNTAPFEVHVGCAKQQMNIFKVYSILLIMVGLLENIVAVAALITNLSSPIFAAHRFFLTLSQLTLPNIQVLKYCFFSFLHYFLLHSRTHFGQNMLLHCVIFFLLIEKT